MKPEDVREEHRDYLDIPDNPRKITTSALFKLVSDTMGRLTDKLTEMKITLTRMDEKQTTSDGKVEHLEGSIDRLADRVGGRMLELEADYHVRQIEVAKNEGYIEERLKWQEKVQKVIITLIFFVIGLLLWILDIPIFP